MIHCPTCSAGLRFDIASQAMTCDHCGNDFEVEKLADSTSNDADSEASYDVYVYVCPDCGGELAVDTKNDAIGFCPYCGGASMLYDRIRKEWKPDTIIPFKITREQCKENYLRKVKKNPFISSQYRNPELIESFRGIYLPYWYFEGRQDGQYCLHETTTGKTSKEVTTTVFEKNYQVAYTLSGISFDASIGFDDHISEQLQPFDTDGQKAFHPGYLSGFYAEIGDADKKEYEAYACEQFQDYTRNLIIESEGSEAKNLIIPTRVQSVSHALHPVWFMSYRRKNELIYVAVNGQTGKVAADLPLSPLRILMAALLSVLLIFGAVYLVMNLLPSIKAGATLMICSLLTFTCTALLQDTYLTTLARCLHMPIRTAHPSIRIPSCIVTALLVAGIILIATDGSYGKARAIFGGVLSVPSFCIWFAYFCSHLVFSYRVHKGLRTGLTSQLESGVIKTAKAYNVLFICLCSVLFVGSAALWFLGFMEIPGKLMCYLLCAALGACILALAMVHIAFQTTGAKRRPVQMNKKGAYYDEK